MDKDELVNRENEKYTKEMNEYADKNELKGNLILGGSALFIVIIIIFSILLNTPLMKPKADVVTSSLASKDVVKSAYSKPSAAKPVETPDKIFGYLNVETNRAKVLKKATQLNKGSQKGVTVYLLSEILRLNAVAIPAKTTSVKQLMQSLITMHWKKNTDFNQLVKGDICFTTDMPKKVGVPSHVYVFMGWVKDGKTDYAYVCDGQIEQYGNVLHKRNISIPTTKNDKFNFFLRQ